ncbi:DOPA 4,5-dioxygenase family protein [Novacetimonas hansenii]|uniref:DOPA 4,5-dioxygenase family protein n=1 Tax=Novacetimonas hansenii TaxID=436 RepID=UPI000796D862|nr:DOPA 4,5-dioxygenase family protein [Novacetimonas hansenii]QOF94378.1 DOPA 4,5-dioxygenase family protein [Novacetimonas hansenii]WEQ59740.1 DOPA 4,5-dioxygenase family protein [Novacetimonas hansenii]CUW47824.1 Dopa 4,5-dioxygenase family [Novacetimonas hansenii]
MDTPAMDFPAAAVRHIDEIASYHAHIYFSAETMPGAVALRDALSARFSVRVGHMHQTPVGPHSANMFQVAFETSLFATFVPWLMLNRNGLTILIHPNTTYPRHDHDRDSLWLGTPLPLRTGILPLVHPSADEAGPPNTTPDPNMRA